VVLIITMIITNLFLDFGFEPSQITEFWRRAERHWPVLAAIARDYLAIPAASVGVERLFNMARDICSYRRHHLKPATIRDLVITMCTDRFLLLEELDNIEATEEAEEARLPEEPEDQEIFEIEDLEGLISDEEDSIEDLDLDNDRMAHRAVDEDGEEDNEDEEPEDFALPALRRAGLSQTRPQGLHARNIALFDRLLAKKTGPKTGKVSKQAVKNGKQRAS
jgi:hypothetical protein